jgi:hypothetical protein
MASEKGRLVQVGSAPSQIVAQMWQEFLQQEGVATVVSTSDGYAYLGALAPCALLAAADQADRARELLAALEEGDPPEGGEADKARSADAHKA